ncbi:MAG: Fe-S cluster assembly transcription factor [Burkholderiales bacterium]|jgi:Rrf2 family iron-sulfur cluster assembly transcriptional regulator|nr:Fe-S cluster assembly transcription factor [Burkholderiales bacterium]MBL6878538.1 Fe-S cluster assembly transcription factor [Burkholderiales bacterium]MCH1425483.1 Fe-S cluster assembly transcription factor [Burkholderiales bacterium]
MRLTTKGRFAVTAMMDIALQEGVRPVALSEISERQNISLSYLEQLFGKLRRRALVTSVRGPGGGYRISQPTETITVGEIIRAVDETVDATQCGGLKNCKDDKECITHELWTGLNEHIFDYMDTVKLADLVEKRVFKMNGVHKVKFEKINRV